MYEILIRNPGDIDYRAVDWCVEAELPDVLAKWQWTCGDENVIAERC